MTALFEEDELPPMPGKVEQQAFDIWNDVAGRAGWPKATKLNPDRQRRLKKAVKEAGSLIAWREMLERGAKSTFLTTKFKPDLEFVTRPAKLLKIMEGGFDDMVSYAPSSFAQQMKGIGVKTRYAEPPKEIFKHDIESPEDRMAFTIAKYRERGKWADANRVEEQLAVLQKRPAVLVPSPDTAHLTGRASHAAATVPEKSPADREADRRRAFEAKNRANATDVPSWLEEDIPADAYRDGP